MPNSPRFFACDDLQGRRVIFDLNRVLAVFENTDGNWTVALPTTLRFGVHKDLARDILRRLDPNLREGWRPEELTGWRDHAR